MKRAWLALGLCAGLGWGFSSQAADSERSFATVPVVTDTISMKDMGLPNGLHFSKGQSVVGASFPLPDDKIVLNAQLILNAQYAAEQGEDTQERELDVQLNGESLGRIPLIGGSEARSFELEIPPVLLLSENHFSLHLHREQEREECAFKPAEQVALTILPDSRFTLTSRYLNVQPDLHLFPRPFLDRSQMGKAHLQFAFAHSFTADSLEAGALLASWFGVQADHRSLDTAVYLGRLPEKNGIVIGRPGDKIGGLTLPETAQPLIKVIHHPENPVWKLLLLVGNDAKQLQDAAWRVTRLGFDEGSVTALAEEADIPARQPYDAPRWMRTDRPVHFTELLKPEQKLSAFGLWHPPLRVNFRIAPDLFLWPGDKIALNIDYRFPQEAWIDEERSWLSVSLNNTFLDALPVYRQRPFERLRRLLASPGRQENKQLALDAWRLAGDNQLTLHFNIAHKSDVDCIGKSVSNIVSRIGNNAWIDLTKTRRFGLLPNLSWFIGASLPFSRLADYAQTVFLLPSQASEQHISTLLNLAGRAGSATGVTLTRHRVSLGPVAENQAILRDRDFIAISTMRDEAFNRALFADSVFEIRPDGLGVREPGVLRRMHDWLTGELRNDAAEADRYLSSNHDWRGFLSFRSPWADKRLVVLAIGSDGEQLARLNTDLDIPARNAGIRGDMTIITDGSDVRSFQAGPQYVHGRLPFHEMVMWYASRYAVLLALIVTGSSVLTGFFLFGFLKKRADKRLNKFDSHS